MPFKSDAQRRFMHAKHPGIASRWEDKYDTPKGLPERKRKKKRSPALDGLRNARNK